MSGPRLAPCRDTAGTLDSRGGDASCRPCSALSPLPVVGSSLWEPLPLAWSRSPGACAWLSGAAALRPGAFGCSKAMAAVCGQEDRLLP